MGLPSMNRLITALLSAVAVSAIAASPALAFDKVNWEWKSKIDTHVDIDAYINLRVYIDGMVQVEKLQIFLGNVEAEAEVSHIYNTPFYPVVDTKKQEGCKEKCDYGFKPDDKHMNPQTYAIDNGYGRYHDFDKINVSPLDATTQLPIVSLPATAIGNNQSITSDVPIFLHDGQFVANVQPEYDSVWSNALSAPDMGGWGSKGRGGNSNTELAGLFLLGSAFGILTHAEISAETSAYDIKNASVDASATAVANNVSITLATNDVENHVLIADITQFALANVSAETDVHNVSATGYTNMRQLTTATLQTVDGVANVPVNVPTPWINAAATAIGNNVSINVGLVPKTK